MANSPEEETVAKFTEITNVDHSSAVNFLKSRGNNLENAINAFFGGQDGIESTTNEDIAQYDERAFSSDRQGELSQTSNYPAFQIDAGVVDSGPKYQNAAPSRPPSRSEHLGSDNLVTKAPFNEHDEQFSKQTSGTVNTSQHAFGPANRAYYDPAQWAVTHPISTSRDCLPDLPPGDRRRAAEEPVLMKPLAFDDDLPSLIAILGSIPGAFNFMCLKMPLLMDYGYDPSWWQGAPIAGSDSSHVNDDNDTLRSAEELIAETQKLMAFIKCTSRAYGSVEVLSSLKLLHQIDKSEPSTKKLADRFLLAWDTAANAVAPLHGPSKLFRSVAHQAVGDEVAYTPFWCFECTLENISEAWTLYDAVDSAIWSPDQGANPNSSAFIQQAADVFVIRLIQPDTSASGLMISIPQSWYIDRYLPENAKAAKKMRLNMAQCRTRLTQILGMQNNLLQFNSLRDGRTFDALDLLKTVISYFEEPNLIRSSTQTDVVGDDTTSGRDKPVAYATITEQLKGAFRKVASKYQALENEKEALQKAYLESSNLLKGPTGEDDQVPNHEYHLCGVTTKPGVTYIMHSDGSDTNTDEMASPKSRQWWRMEYTSEPRITKQRVNEKDVLEAAQSESRRAMLVYAKPGVLFAEQHDLPQQLMDFVNEDNDAFASEEETWRNSKVDNNRDWDAEWRRHVPEDWPPVESENEGFKKERSTQAEQSNEDETHRANLRNQPQVDESELRGNVTSSQEASSNTMDASSRSEKSHPP